MLFKSTNSHTKRR